MPFPFFIFQGGKVCEKILYPSETQENQEGLRKYFYSGHVNAGEAFAGYFLVLFRGPAVLFTMCTYDTAKVWGGRPDADTSEYNDHPAGAYVHK